MCETKLGENENCNIEGYETIPSNFKRGQEGLIVAARSGTFASMDKVSESYNNILSVQIVYPERTLRVIVCHGLQEDDESESRQDFFDNLLVEIERSRAGDETPIVVGDMNAKISMEQDKLQADSVNGRMFIDMLEISEMKVANFHEKTIGKWTRIQKDKRKKGPTKSVLDYVLVDEQMMSLITEVNIDEEKCDETSTRRD